MAAVDLVFLTMEEFKMEETNPRLVAILNQASIEAFVGTGHQDDFYKIATWMEDVPFDMVSARINFDRE